MVFGGDCAGFAKTCEYGIFVNICDAREKSWNAPYGGKFTIQEQLFSEFHVFWSMLTGFFVASLLRMTAPNCILEDCREEKRGETFDEERVRLAGRGPL